MEQNYTIVFDFDGTVVDSAPELFKIVNELSPIYGFKYVEEGEIEAFKGMGSKEVFKNLGISMFKLPEIALRIRKKLGERVLKLKPVGGIPLVLKTLNKRGYRLGILTSNSAVNVRKFLKANNLEYFSFIHSESNIFGKARILKKLKNKMKNIVYVGDETRDVEASKKCDIKVVAVTWGYNSKEPLLKSKPDWLLSHPNELLKIFTKE
jgi:phosphoglycolate phosphatase-like HAD superfamily hydrolase